MSGHPGGGRAARRRGEWRRRHWTPKPGHLRPRHTRRRQINKFMASYYNFEKVWPEALRRMKGAISTPPGSGDWSKGHDRDHQRRE